jgi:hypothetical protein
LIYYIKTVLLTKKRKKTKMTKIVDTSEKLPKIVDTGETCEKISPEEVAEALGAEIITDTRALTEREKMLIRSNTKKR